MKRRLPDAIQALSWREEFDVVELLRRASPVFLVIGAWLAFHPYTGIVHDARLYAAQALQLIHPEVFSDDLFFVFGSQDDFTIFSYLFAPLIERIGPHAAAFAIVVVGQTVWLSGAALLAVRLAPSTFTAVAGLVVLSVMPASYGGAQTFVFGEGIPTPRLLAEGLTLWSLWALTTHRLLLAVLFAALAALLHPLVGLVAIGVGWLFLLMSDRRWLFVGFAGLVGAIILTLTGITPFDRLQQTIDPEWLTILRTRNFYLFPSLWLLSDWCRIAVALMTALATAFVLSGWQRNLVLAIVFASLAGVGMTWVGADLIHNLFLTQLQSYRALWLLHVISYVGSGVLLVLFWRLAPDGVALCSLLVFSWLLGLVFPLAGAIVSGLVLAFAVARLRDRLAPIPFSLQVAGIGLAGCAIIFLGVYRAIRLSDRFAVIPTVDRVWDLVGGVTVIEVAVVAVLTLALFRFRPAFVQQALPFAALTLLILAAVGWDRRDAWTRALTDEYPVTAFENVLQRDAQVYWEDDVRGAWLLLRRPSYVSEAQGAGIVFERRTALSYRERGHIIENLARRGLDDVRTERGELKPPLPPVDQGALISTCLRDRALDAIILSRPVDGIYAARWSLQEPIYSTKALMKGIDRPPTQHFYLYRCADLR